MSITNIELLAQIATWVTAFLVLLTLLEMIRQRKSTYKPDVVISRAPIYAYLGKVGLPSLWFSHKLTDEEIETVSSVREGYSIPVHNLGLGAARDVQFSWSYDIEEFIHQIDLISKYNPVRIEISILDENYLKIEVYERMHSGTDINSDLEKSVDFILPASIESEGFKLFVPSSYIMLVSIYLLNLVYREKKDESFNINILNIDLPSLELKVLYRDIGGSRHSKKFQLNLSYFFLRIGDLLDGDLLFSAFLE